MTAPPGHRRLVVFDWDGTLIDSTAAIVEAICGSAADIGLPIPSRERASHVSGLGLGDAIRYACPQVVAGPLREDADWSFNLRATRVVRGRLEARSGERLVWSRRVHALTERRFSIGAGVLAPFSSEPVRITLTED